MSTLLYIQSSPRGERSVSGSVATKFIEAYQDAHPEDVVESIDLWKTRLPELTGVHLEAAYAAKNGDPLSSQHHHPWQEITEVSDTFRSADKYLLSVPMWNFGIPYKLKHYIDLLVQSGLTFTYEPENGYQGLVTGKPLVVIYARGGAYTPGSEFESADLQSPYVRRVFEFIGFSDIREVFVEPTAMGRDLRDAAIAAATRKVEELGRTL